MEVEIGMEMEVEVEMHVDRKLKNMVVVLMFLLVFKKHGRIAGVFNKC